MESNSKFEDIRPYDDSEVHNVIKMLMKEPNFNHIISSVFPKTPLPFIEVLLKDIHTKDEFQQRVIYDIFTNIANKTTTTLECSGLDHLSKEQSYTFISNHRDIVLDAAWLNVLFFSHDFPTTEVAIGDNLFVQDWIKVVSRLNKSFIVKRSVTGRAMLEASANLSDYIHYTINEKHASIWIAQREGRAKDSDDRTQESLLKMLGMGGSGIIPESLKELNIVPFTFSYEYDPCDFLKAKEFQLKRDNKEYKKTKEEDWLNMKTGLNGKKGRVHFRAGYSINPFLQSLDPELSKTEKVAAIAAHIDQQIHHNYHIYPSNYVAYDMLYGVKRFASYYSEEEEDSYMDYLNGQLNKIELKNKDTNFLRRKMLEMYSNPLKNKLIADGINL